MADIYTFPTRARTPRDLPASPGVLVAMAPVDLDEAVQTGLLLSDAGAASCPTISNAGHRPRSSHRAPDSTRKA